MRFLLLLFALAMPTIAWFSNQEAFGPDNGTISDRHPTLLVAAGYAFSVWGLIFLLDLGFALWQLRRDAHLPPRVRGAAALGFACTAAWMPVFSQQWFGLALGLIWTALAALLYAAIAMSRPGAAGTRAARWLAWLPLSLHAGWLSLAAFLNLAQVIVAYRWLSSVDMLGWSLALLAAAAVLLLLGNRAMRGNLGYAGVALWGLVAVYVKQAASPLDGAEAAAWIALAIGAVLVAQTAVLRRRAA
jgi:hypothetical protein